MAFDVNKQLDRAKRFLEKNKVEDAIQTYQSVLAEQPGHLESLQSLGDIYTRLGQPDQAATYYALVFDQLFESREENKAQALYTRALRIVRQPPERMARYALLLQRQNRADDAIEQYSLASELFQARGKEEAALECIERVAQLDSENAARQCAVGDLAERLGKTAVAARAFLRAGQLSESAGDAENALELLKRAHKLVPVERGPALLYAQALLRRGDPATAVEVLEPFDGADLDVAGLATLGEALMKIGALDRARSMFERLPSERPGTAVKLFELAGCYLASHQDDQAVALLRKIKQPMMAARQENDFIAQLDALVESYPDSIALAEFWAGAYSELNRETKYFDALVRLFDMYLAAGNIGGACDALEKLVDIDPYDSRNQQRLDRLTGRADDAFLARMHTRLGQVATHAAEPTATPAPTAPPVPEAEADHGQHALEDLIVQAEIFIQYSLQTKAVERLQKITELFPGEEERNERLRNLCQLANWWPTGANAKPPRAKTAASSLAAPAPAVDSVDTMRDLARISEISQSLYRLTSPRAILSASIQEMGLYLKATRCVAVIGPAGKPPQMASEFCAPGVEPAPGALLVRLLAQLEHASPDKLGGLPIDVAAAPLLRELGLETALAVVLTDPEIRAQAGMVIAGHATAHVWRPHETYFMQAVGDQMLLGVNHIRLRNLARSIGTADEKTGLLARSSYQDCLLNETQRAKSQSTALSLALLQMDRGPELLRQHGEAQVERYMEQLAQALGQTVRQADIAVKYTSWTIAFILPDTALSGAQTLVEKLREAGAQVQPSWDGKPLTLSASVTEAVARTDFDTEDIVTELINRAEAGLQEAQQRGGDSIVALSTLAS
jgi:diguanylate cyclase (GGDEF)-like protein